jgi:glycine cleavage system H protein
MTHQVPSELRYTKEHEWAKIEGDIVTIGITDFAQSSLGDIVYIELPEKGTQLERDSAFGVVESIKSVSDLYAPISGEVIDSNDSLSDGPEKVNEGPYDSWIVKIKVSDTSQLNDLLEAKAYIDLCNSEE